MFPLVLVLIVLPVVMSWAYVYGRERRMDRGMTVDDRGRQLRNKADGSLTQFQGDGFTCPKCRHSVATNVCPFDGTIIVSGPRTHETWSPKGTVPFRPKVN